MQQFTPSVDPQLAQTVMLDRLPLTWCHVSRGQIDYAVAKIDFAIVGPLSLLEKMEWLHECFSLFEAITPNATCT